MKRLNSCLPLAAVALAAACISGPASAARVFVGVGVGVPLGVPLGVPYYYPYYPVAPVPYYYPPVVAAPAPPVNYVEQVQPGPSADTSGLPGGSWYYCEASRAYYPYVRDCPAGWRPVAPQPSQAQ